MNRINKNMFSLAFAAYLVVTSIIILTKIPDQSLWFDQWFFDKFFVFQFISIVTIGLIIEGRRYHCLSYIRMGDRKQILRDQFLKYYRQVFVYLNIMFICIILGASWLHVLNQSQYILQIVEWYVRYILGMMMYINLMLCLDWSNSSILNRYGKLFVFLWLSIELIIVKPYIKRFFSIDINLIFSWVFYSGAVSYFVMLFWIVVAAIISFRLSAKRDFV